MNIAAIIVARSRQFAACKEKRQHNSVK
jgi:hypothetical protein